MIICICNGISTQDIQDTELSLEAFIRKTGASLQCGKCAPTLYDEYHWMLEVLKQDKG